MTNKIAIPEDLQKIINKIPENRAKEVSIMFSDYLFEHKDKLSGEVRKRLRKIVKKKS